MGSGEGSGMSDKRLTQATDQGDAITPRNQLSDLSITASAERKRIRESSPQAMVQYERKKVTNQSSFSPHLLQRALGETSTGHPMPTFTSPPSSSIYASAPLRSSVAGGFNMNAVGLPSAASSRAPSMTRIFERPSTFMPSTHISDMSLARPYSDMTPTAFANNSSFPVVAPETPMLTSLTNMRSQTFMPPPISVAPNASSGTHHTGVARNMVPAAFANNSSFPVVAFETPMLTSLTNMRPQTFMPPPISAAPTAPSGTHHTGVARNMIPSTFANNSLPVVSPEVSILTSVANPPTPLMPQPLPTAPTASAGTVPHHIGVGRSSFTAAFASNSFYMVSPEGSILRSAANLGLPLMPQRTPTASTASAWTVPHQTGMVRSTFPAAFGRCTYPAVSPVGNILSSMVTSGPPTRLAPPISFPQTASARTAPGHTGLVRSSVPALSTVVPGALTFSANTPAPAHAPRSFPVPNMTPSDIEALRKPLLPRASSRKASLPHTAPQGSTMTARIKWEGFDKPEVVGVNCMLCKRDLAFSPEGPISIPSTHIPVAVLPCGHTFHDHCLQLITPEDQLNSPPCIPCAIGED